MARAICHSRQTRKVLRYLASSFATSMGRRITSVRRRYRLAYRPAATDVELIESRRLARASRSPEDVILIWF